MISQRQAQDHEHFDHGWLDPCRTLSIGHRYDTEQLEFSVLRDFNF